MAVTSCSEYKRKADSKNLWQCEYWKVRRIVQLVIQTHSINVTPIDRHTDTQNDSQPNRIISNQSIRQTNRLYK